jgi:adenine phosphoribosyltransferase
VCHDSATQLSSAKITLQSSLRQFLDFPIPGIDFIDILPLFASTSLHTLLIDTLALQIETAFNGAIPEVIVALDARGFLFGPSLALKLGAGFAPVRKKGKLPGPTVEAAFVKEYGEDWFQMQGDAVRAGQKVLVVDDIIATGKCYSPPFRTSPLSIQVLHEYWADHGNYTGGSAQAAGALVEKLGGILMGYMFILEIDFLKGRDKLNAPVHTLLYYSEKRKTE